MSVRSYYRRALLLPIAVPVLAYPAFLLGSDVLAGMALWLWWSIVFGGVPYALFALGFLLWTRGRTDAEVRRGILLAPLAYVAVLVPCMAVFLAVDGGFAPGFLGMIAAFGLAFGYGYVALAEIGRLLFRPGSTGSQPLPAA
jgi:hypothetical protein